MASGNSLGPSPDSVLQLETIFGPISNEDCILLKETYGGNEAEEVVHNIFEALDSSTCNTLAELVADLRRKKRGQPCSGEGDESWTVARSKSSLKGAYKAVPTAKSHLLDSETRKQMAPIPFNGTQNPVRILRTSVHTDVSKVRALLSTMMQDPELRRFLQDITTGSRSKRLILLRGPSGSGKSTLAQVLWAITRDGEVCSIDNYFTDRKGVYKFPASDISQAIESCQKFCKLAMGRGETPIIIDNCNIKVAEMMPYVELALEHRYGIDILEPNTEWKKNPEILAKKNIHGVSKARICEQLRSYEETTVEAMTNLVQPASRESLERASSDFMDRRKMPWFAGEYGIQSETLWEGPEPQSAPKSGILLSDCFVPDLKKKSKGSAGQPKGNELSKSKPAIQAQTALKGPAQAALSQLRCLFPTVPEQEMKLLYVLYKGEVDACVAALIERGAEMAGASASAEGGSQKPNGVSAGTGPVTGQKNGGNVSVELALPADFLKALMRRYGKIPGLAGRTGLSRTLNVKIPPGVALEFYNTLRSNMREEQEK